MKFGTGTDEDVYWFSNTLKDINHFHFQVIPLLKML